MQTAGDKLTRRDFVCERGLAAAGPAWANLPGNYEWLKNWEYV